MEASQPDRDSLFFISELRVLTDPVRLALIWRVANQDFWRGGRYKPVAEMAEEVGVSPALASYHLLAAKKAGIVRSPARGKFSMTPVGQWWLRALRSRHLFQDEIDEAHRRNLELLGLS